MNVGDWLRGLGLERYEAAFRENEINERVLASLTQEDLREIGVGPVGHRRILLEAVAALRTDATGNAPSTHRANTSNALDLPPEDRAERRQVTVMFSDLVGSTALSARLDPEDMREVITAYQGAVAETIGRFGGFVAKYMGDGALVYFGYPQANEDDAERAVRAGLDLVAAVGALKTHAPLQTRVGIATGLVVVGDLIGSGASQEQAIVGETPNLAARLQGVAEPDNVVIAESTRRLVGSLFELDDLGPRDLKGIKGPVRAWAALRPASVEGRFEAMHGGGLPDLVGREDELDFLLRRWSKAKSGEGQVVLLSGEAGIGKSRLTAALLERLAPEPHTRLRYFCSPQYTDSAFYPLIGQFERAGAFVHGDTLQAKLDKLDTLLAQTSTSKQDAALFAEMLSLPNDSRYPVLELTSQQRREKTLEALSRQVETLARFRPVLMIFEDAQWADPTSLEAFGRTVDRIASLRMILLIVTFRPEFEAPWFGQPHVTTLALNRLGHREISTLIDHVVGNKVLPVNIRKDIVERTDGIPLFVEEMTKAVLEAGGELEAMRTAAAVPSPALAVPASLHASLMARLDRLGPAKEVAQIGAAIGREFSHALLAAVIRKPDPELGASLGRLIGAGLLFRKGVPPHATYLFKHALVQDAAYGTLLRQPRCALHARIAEILESQFTGIAEVQPELLARHCTEAGLIEKAAGLWGKAGQRSLARSALVEAVAQLIRALDQIAALPGSRALRREQITLQVALLNTLMWVRGAGALETRAATERASLLIEQARALGEAPEDPLLLFSVLYSFWLANFAAFNGDSVRDLSAHFLALAEKQGERVPLMIAHRITGASLLLTGNIAAAQMHFEGAIALYDPSEDRPLATRFNQDTRVISLSWLSLVMWLLGYPDAALAISERALHDAREVGQPASLIYALAITALTLIHRGNYPTAKAQSDDLVALASEKSAVMLRAFGVMNQGLLSAADGKAHQAVHTIRSGIAALRSTGTISCVPLYLMHLAKAHAELSQFDKSSRCADEAMTNIETTKETWCEAEAHRLAGELALTAPERDVPKANTCFERALVVARQQQAKSWELRAATSMARLWRDQGKRDDARELLAPIYGWFTEGFDTRDLREAKALLTDLA